MVFLILTRAGYEELVAQFRQPPSPLWVNTGVLSPGELAQLRQAGSEVTDFSCPINIQDSSAIEVAISTVQEHHAGKRVWVEYAANL